MSRKILCLILLFGFTIAQAQNSKASSSLNLEWKSRGPSNVSGITRAILWDKDDENIIYTGGIASGLFKSLDKGNSWQKLGSYADNNPSIASIAQSINGSIFVGTGFRGGASPMGYLFDLAFNGNGIYRSQDAGNTWTHINSTAVSAPISYTNEWSDVKAIAAHPTLYNLLMVGNNSGIKVSTNAESAQPTFSNSNGVGPNVTDIKFTSNGAEAWVAANGKIYHSTDLANNFSTFNLNSLGNGATAKLALSKVDTNGNYTIYASITNSSGCLVGLYKSENNGVYWIQIVLPGGQDPFEFSNGGCQGWYSHTLAVNPNNKDIVYVGGVTLYTVTTQGDFVQIDDIMNENASDFLPDGKHTIVFNPNNDDEMMIGTDLGIYLSSNALVGYPYNISFETKSKNLNTSNILNADLGKNGDILISGYQNTHYLDYSSANGPYFTNEIWNNSNATAIISNYEESTFLFSGYYGSLRKSIDFGATNFPFLDSNLDPAGCNTVSCTILSQFENCGDIINQGMSYNSENYFYESATKAKFFVPTRCGSKLFLCSNPTSLTETPIYNSFYIPFQVGIKDIDISADGNRVVFGSGSRVGILDGFDAFVPSIPNDANANTAQIDIRNIDLNIIDITSIAGISIDKNNKDHIIVVEEGYGSLSKVAKTIDGGLNWIIIQNNLPEIPVFDCIIDANNSDNYILATLQGIYTSNDAGLTWNEDNSGIGKLPIYRIKQKWVLEEDCFVLLAATAGNGVYTSTTLTNCNRNIEDEIWGLFNPINEIDKDKLVIKIYPNPTKNRVIVSIENDTEAKTIQVFDLYGKRVYSNVIEMQLEIETQNWAAGIYYISIGNAVSKLVVL